MMKKRLVGAAIGLAVLGGGIGLGPVASADPGPPTTTLEMDEVAPTPVDGLTVNGVTFGFTGGDAFFNAGGPGPGSTLPPPHIEGAAAGTLTVTFDVPTTVVGLSVARSTVDTIPDGAIVELIAPSGKTISTTEVETSPVITFSEGRFDYAGSAVKMIRVTFGDPFGGFRFALDDLEYFAPPGQLD